VAFNRDQSAKTTERRGKMAGNGFLTHQEALKTRPAGGTRIHRRKLVEVEQRRWKTLGRRGGGGQDTTEKDNFQKRHKKKKIFALSRTRRVNQLAASEGTSNEKARRCQKRNLGKHGVCPVQRRWGERRITRGPNASGELRAEDHLETFMSSSDVLDNWKGKPEGKGRI